MKKTYTLIILFTLIFSQGFSQKTYLSDAINIAGKQRMLGQRMAKDKVYIEANVLKDKADYELEKTIKTFEKGMQILYDFAPTQAIKHKIDIQEYTFRQYKKEITDNSKKSLREAIKRNTLFLAICDDIVTELINYSKTSKNSDLNKNQKYIIKNIAMATGSSGKLRYLTQRLTLYFAVNEFEITSVSNLAIQEIIETMDKNLNYLTALSFNTLEIDDALSEVQYYWSSLKDSLYFDGKVSLEDTEMTAKELFDLCNTILGRANSATKMYADLNKS